MKKIEDLNQKRHTLKKRSIVLHLKKRKKENPWLNYPKLLITNRPLKFGLIPLRDQGTWGGEEGKSKIRKIDEYFHTALEEDNFKVAASYITDSKRIAELEQRLTPEAYEKIETDLVYGIASEYDRYLSEVIEKCYQHDYDSVFRKVMWMNFFLAEHPNAFIPGRYVKDFSLDEIFRKGNEALDSIEYCIEKRIP